MLIKIKYIEKKYNFSWKLKLAQPSTTEKLSIISVLSYLFIIIQESIETIIVAIVLEAIENSRQKKENYSSVVILGDVECWSV